MRILQLNLRGGDVGEWQQFLSDQGFKPIDIDNVFGEATKARTEDFQRASGFMGKDVDGVVGNETLAAAMARGFAPLPDTGDETPSSKVKLVRTVADGVSLFKLVSGEAVFFTSRMHVDADGCPQAYGPNNSGIENNKAAKKKSGAFSGDVLVLDSNRNPVPQKSTDPAPDFFISKTALQDRNAAARDPSEYVDALNFPYIVLPGGGAGGAGAGDAALVIDETTGMRVKAIVGDIGPSDETGEASMYLAGLISGLSPTQITEAEARKKGSFVSPRSGGTEKRRFRYIALPKTTMVWTKLDSRDKAAVKQRRAEIEAHLDGALAALTHDQVVTITIA
jgi:peptidoglycan hydrolase-like protein with peptidoglycan-binding domain